MDNLPRIFVVSKLWFYFSPSSFFLTDAYCNCFSSPSNFFILLRISPINYLTFSKVVAEVPFNFNTIIIVEASVVPVFVPSASTTKLTSLSPEKAMSSLRSTIFNLIYITIYSDSWRLLLSFEGSLLGSISTFFYYWLAIKKIESKKKKKESLKSLL